MFPRMFFQWILTTLLTSSCSPTNFDDMSNIFFKVRSVEFIMEFWLSRKFFPMNVAAFNVAAMNIPQVIECSSPESATFDILWCFFALDLLLYAQILLRVTSHDESLRFRHFLGVDIITSCPDRSRSIRPYLTDCASPSKFFSVMRTNLMYNTPRSFIRFHWSIVYRNLTFPLLRRPSTVIIQFWITCWGEFIRLPWSTICNNRSPRILISVPCLPRVSWSWRRHDRRHPRC